MPAARRSSPLVAMASRRVASQLIDRPLAGDPTAVVSHFGAIQAQDYLGALWVIGLRLRAATERGVEAALAERSIVRTWPMRGTLHFVPAEDARWMLELLTPRVLARSVGRHRTLELDRATFTRSGRLLERALHGGNQLPRSELYQMLNRAGIATHEARGLHLLAFHAQHRLICFGSRVGKQPTFALFDEWIPESRPRDRDASLAELARRYFTSHGPATAHDFAWWSGLTLKEVREAIALAGDHIADETIEGRTYWSGDEASAGGPRGSRAVLLPPFDELTVAYQDRSPVLDPAFARRLNAGGGMLKPTVLMRDRLVATWRRVLRNGTVEVTMDRFDRSDSPLEHLGIDRASSRYARFLGLPLARAE